MEFTLLFLELFLKAMRLGFPLLAFFFLMITLFGQWVGRLEGWSRFDAFYWSFITALTVGYGDFRPSSRKSKVLALATATVGIMFSGVFVAVTVAAATEAFHRYMPGVSG
ncbi:potassium channel family protein [Alcanivorax sp. DP30]|uniref:potassium channel family protein n=1 Tax=Alcanivorax sp. DP30 TaxID=2606217 RepID=UPI00136BD522|nr:potassium channel family protein [Alcanivorax sp. DP30]MZR62786.1 two pore domain potassium channel family protein [Alcanivorax sp. DP30]